MSLTYTDVCKAYPKYRFHPMYIPMWIETISIFIAKAPFQHSSLYYAQNDI